MKQKIKIKTMLIEEIKKRWSKLIDEIKKMSEDEKKFYNQIEY